jgi:DNA polymerase III subunit alpha
MPFVDVHVHSDYSPLDGLSYPAEIAAHAAADGAPAIALTDHGNCSGHPQFQRECLKAGVAPLLGMEAYFTPDRRDRPAAGDKEAQQRLRKYSHLVLIAQDNQGLADLWALSTEAFVSGHYYKPRCDWELLERYGGHLIATTACLGGILSRPLLDGDYTRAMAYLHGLQGIFGDRLYLEVQPNGLPDQLRLNSLLAEVSQIAGVPLVAASDGHFPSAAHRDAHKTWIECQTGSRDEAYWNFDHLRTGAEMREGLAPLGSLGAQALQAGEEIAACCTARIGGHSEPPALLSPQADAATLWAACDQGMDDRHLTGQEYRDRLLREWQLVAEKKMAGCYLIVADLCRWARSRGILVGFRGSATASLMNYLLGITYIDPLQYGLMFERFLTPGRTSLPDFDFDFPSSRREEILAYVTAKYGAEHVVRVGTHMRYRNKGILQKLFSVMKEQLPATWFEDSRQIAAIIDEAESHTAGLGMPWAQLSEQCAAELAPWRDRYPRLFELAGQLTGRLNAYGQHPAGLVISTARPLAGQIPMRAGENGSLISQWDYRDLDILGLLKLDLLTIRNLDTVAEAITLVRERRGVTLDPPSWQEEYSDPQAWDLISSGRTVGMFQTETTLGSAAARRMQPRSITDLAALISLVRPGPRNSGMAESYYRRRAGTEEITWPHPRLQPHLEATYGIMLYQEHVMQAVTELGGYDGAEADEVRAILGKKKKELMPAAGEKFIARCQEHGITEEEALAVWDQMSEWCKYGFNIAHAVAYAILSFWTAYLKAHYPEEMLTAILSTLRGNDKDRIPDYVTEARRCGIPVAGPHVNTSGSGFRLGDDGVIRYGLDSVKGVGPAAVTAVTAAQPYVTYEDFTARSGVNSGVLWTLARAGALDTLAPSRRGLVTVLEADRTGASTTCVHKDERLSGPHGLPCGYDWAAEPVPVRLGRRGQELKPLRRPPPARCTRACRRYSPPALLDAADVAEYTPAQLWRLENEIFGTWLSPAAFAQLDELSPGLRAQAREFALSLPDVPPGTYPVLGVISGIRMARTRTGNIMHWLDIATEVSRISLAVFSRGEQDEDLARQARCCPEGALVHAEAEKKQYYSSGWRTSWQLLSLLRLKG